MKRITSILLLIATVFTVLTMSSCSKGDGAPEGMQLVMGGADEAFSFYGPEEWVVANLGEIACTYASKVDTTSMTFTEIAKPEGTVREYFESEKTKFPYEITVVTDGESCSFGNADKLALKYVYTYTYKEQSYSCMQIFVENGGKLYLFTYTSSNNDRDPDHTYYEFYLEKVTASIDAFVFNGKEGSHKDENKFDKTSDGKLIVSDKTLAGFVMYVPESYTVDYSSAFVSVSKSGVNITMSETTYPASTQSEYWEKRRADLEALADKTTVDGKSVSTFTEISAPVKVDAGNADAAVAYEYSYSLDGVEYHTYQILLRKGTLGGSVYVYTYTATNEAYATGLDEAKSIFEGIEF